MTKDILLLLVLYMSCTVCPTPHKAKRQSCTDGDHVQEDGQTCCNCGRGQYLETLCINSPDDRRCQFCEDGITYNSYPTKLMSCEPCTSCNPKVYLEQLTKCTIYQNTVCQCQEGFFCVGGKISCSSCQRCTTCGDEGIEVDCSATNDTKCNDFKEPGGGGHPAIYVVLAALIVICIAVFILFSWKKKKLCFGPSTNPANRTQEPPKVEIPLLPKGLDLQPHIHEIAVILGWKDMKQIAERSGMADTKIQSHQMDNPNNCEEQCFSLLKAWLEQEGKNNASEKLIKILHTMKKRSKAEKIIEMFKSGGGCLMTEPLEIPCG